VFRAAVLPIVLTLAVAPNSSLLCRAFCRVTAAAESACHHGSPATSPSIAGDDSCDDLVLSAAFLREEVRAAVSAPKGDDAVPVLRYQLGRTAPVAGPGREPGREWSVERRPLPTVLRL
jgi:hypothetical protein